MRRGRAGAFLAALAIAAAPAAGAATPELIEGSYYKSGAPERTKLTAPGAEGETLVLTGRVFSRDRKPIVGARLEFWQADAGGRYDVAGFALRGAQYSDEDGRYRIETIVPGTYANRAPHLHVKVTAPDGRTLVTQLFLQGAPQNASDPLFREDLALKARKTPGGREASFDLVF